MIVEQIDVPANQVDPPSRLQFVTHVAGVIDSEFFVRCARCGRVLQDHRRLPDEQRLTRPPLSVYAPGMLIDVAASWQDIRLEALDASHLCAIGGGR